MHDLPLITTVAGAFAAAWVLGILTHRLGLSPIVGYLLAGVVIGPFTPGFVGDVGIAHQLAEVGVILLMFGVGLHFHFHELLAVRRVAVPGAVVQSLVATALGGALFFTIFDWPLSAGLVLGMAMAVASTVVLLRVLMDGGLLTTEHGRVAVGWLIVEDIFTVLLLVLVPVLARAMGAGSGAGGAPEEATASALTSIGWAVGKLAVLLALVFLAGSRVVPWILMRVARLRSRELFTLTVLVLSIAVAVGSAKVFGASVALGAFLAGMVVGQSPLSHQAASDALPMRDAFAVLFFVSVGMLFDPTFLVTNPGMVAAGLGIVLLAKPAAALLIVALLGYPARTALIVAVGLAQIGEFSFILAEVSREHGLIPEEGTHVLIAAAMVSITLNPILFKSLGGIEAWLRRRPRLWGLLNARADRRMRSLSVPPEGGPESGKPLAIIVGYGPVGRAVDAVLRDTGLETVIVDLNAETVRGLTRQGRPAIYGDATRADILEQAGIRRAAHLVLTLPDAENAVQLVLAARELNADVEITIRARYLQDREALHAAGAATAVLEEAEVGIALATQVMRRRGVEEATIEKMGRALRQLWLRE
ncbi:MAG: cation:proton antiporter [Phycisphaerales bacterium]